MSKLTHHDASPLRRTLAIVGALAVLLATLVVVPASPAAAAPATGTITGVVFRDFNSNGLMDTSGAAATPAVDVGVAGVVVRAFDDAGAEVGTATSSSTGAYTLSYGYDDAGSSRVRLEFTTPDGFEDGPRGVRPATGTWRVSGTSTQFASTGQTADYGIHKRFDYADADPTIVSPIAKAGHLARTEGAIVYNPYVFNTTTASGPLSPVLATQAQVGTVWGTAVFDNRYILSSAFVKRHTPLGPAGVGGIYLSDLDAAAPNGVPWLTIPNAGTNPRPAGADAGTTVYDWASDPAMTIPYVYKTGLGDMDSEPDGSMLYVTNLFDRNLYQVPVTTAPGSAPVPGTPVAIAMPLALPGAGAGCALDQVRPMGLEVTADRVLAALTCTGPARADLRGYVYEYTPSTATWSGAPVLEFGLDYDREPNAGGDPSFRPWTDSEADVYINHNQDDRPAILTNSYALVSDLTSFSNGDLAVGIKSRTNDISGHEVLSPSGNRATLPSGTTVPYFSPGIGDLVLACAAPDGQLVMESNGFCGGRDGVLHDVGHDYGGGEFFFDAYPPTGNDFETQIGASEGLPGFEYLLASRVDPVTSNSNGYNVLSLVNGERDTSKSVELNRDYGKADGVGEIVAVLGDAPIEIGNYVWLDANGDGVQDPSETALEGVTVRLYDGAGALVATKVTDANGEYYFTTADGLLPETDYEIRLDNPADYGAGGPLEGLEITVRDGGTSDLADSDAVDSAGFAVIAYTTGFLSQNDHSLDFGFRPPPPAVFTKELDGPVVTDPDTGLSTIRYVLTVTNESASPIEYTLTDTLQYGGGLVVESASVTNTAPGSIPIDPDWNGIDEVDVVDGPVALAASTTHTYLVTVVASVTTDLTIETADCTLLQTESGTGYLNTATLTVASQELTDIACAPEARLWIQKSSTGPAALNGGGTYSIGYDVTVTNTGTDGLVYDLDDTLQFGDGLGVLAASVANTTPGSIVTSGTWDGVGDVRVASGVALAGGSAHVYSVSVTADLETEITTEAADCQLLQNETGTGFLNRATVTVDDASASATACEPGPRITIDKELVGDPVALDADTARVTYDITVANTGAPSLYDLDDQLLFAPGLTIDAASVSNTTPGTIITSGTWNGVGDVRVASDVEIGNGVTHVYRVVVDATVTNVAQTVGPLGDCQLETSETGTGYFNGATIHVGSTSISDVDCAPTPEPDLGLDKELTSAPVLNGAGNYELTYTIVVSNDGDGATVYDLSDELLFAGELDVIDVSVANTVPGSITTNANFDGVSDLVVASGVTLPGGSSHTYTVVVEARLLSQMTEASADCSLADGESGTGFLNEATVTDGVVSLDDDACAEGPILDIAKELIGEPEQLDEDTVRVTYEVTVSNTDVLEARYDLDDRLLFADGLVIDAASVSNTTPGGISTSVTWNGRDDVRVVSDAVIPADGMHVYTVIVSRIRKMAQIGGRESWGGRSGRRRRDGPCRALRGVGCG